MGDRRLGNYSSCCRLCLTENYSSLKSVFDDASGSQALAQKISTIVGVEITTNDKLSTLICEQCSLKVNSWYDFKENCTENQSRLEGWMNCWNSGDLSNVNFQIKDEPIDAFEYAREPEVIIEDDDPVPIKMEPIEIQPDIMEDYDDDLPPTLTPYHATMINNLENEYNPMDADIFMDDDVNMTINDDNSFDTSALNKTNRNCTICNKLFSTPGNRRKHEKTIHGLTDKALLTYSMSKTFNSISLNRKPISGTIDKKFVGTVSIDEGSQQSSNSQLTNSDVQNEKESSKNKISEDDQSNSTAESDSKKVIISEVDKQKIRFAAGLKLQQRTATPNQQENRLSKIELSYIEKCKAMITMFDTLICACHNVPYKNLKRLFAHLRSLRIWFPIYTCYNCMITFTDRSTNMRHYVKCPRKRLEHLMRLSELKENDDIKTRLYQNFRCTRCKFLFTFYEDFCEHVDTEHIYGEAPYNCSCLKTFNTLEAFRQHVHNSCMLEYYCDMCFLVTPALDEFVAHCVELHDNADGFTLVQEDNYTPRKIPHSRTYVHQERQEYHEEAQKVINPHAFTGNKQKPTACSICGKVYSNYHNMLRHYKIHEETEKNIDCPDCPERFRLNSELKEHYNRVHGGIERQYLFSCPDCGDLFKSLREWNNHKNSHIKKSCQECGKQFDFQTELDQHRSVHLNLKLYRDSKTQKYKSEIVSPSIILICELCDKTFPTRDDLEEHKLIHDDDVPSYNLENGVNEDEQVVDVKPDLSKKYACVTCNKTYTGYGGLWEHNRRKHPGRSITRDYPRACTSCGKLIYNSRAWEIHKNMHNSVQKSYDPHPRAAKYRTQSYDMNDDPEESYHTCKRCFKVFSSKYNLKNHMKSHGINVPPATTTNKFGKTMKVSNTVWCNICHQPCQGLEELKEHKKEHERVRMPKLSNEVELIDRKRPATHVCDICRESFQNSGGLRKHKEEHAAELLHSPMVERQNYVYCKYCKIPFTTVELLNEHMTVEHDEVIKSKANKPKQQTKKYSCNLCKKIFDTAGALCSHQGWHKRGKVQRHMKVQDRSFSAFLKSIPKQEPITESNYGCSTCSATFHNDTSLQLHILEKHRNINATLLSPRCTQCNVEFNNTDEYEQHKELHTMVQVKRQTKPYPCAYCPASFSKSDTLHTHMKQFHKDYHSNVFECTQCDRIFEKQNAYTMHMKMHERDSQTPPSYQKPTSKKFSCSICHQGFDEARDLRNHTISEHPF